MAAATKASEELRVALNPRNPEAMAWFCGELGINLSLAQRQDEKGRAIPDTGPISRNLADVAPDELGAVARGIKAGLLIVAKGQLPEGVTADEIEFYAAPRSRWDPELHDQMKAALAHFDKLTKK